MSNVNPTRPHDPLEDHPAYGIRASDHDGSGSFRDSSPEKASGFSRNPGDRPSAYRRMAAGLSLAAGLLGILLFFGLAASGHSRWALIGIAPVLVGAAGLVSVWWRLLPAFREPGGRPHRRPGARWFWIPIGMLLISVVFFVISYLIPGWLSGEDSVHIRTHVLIWSELGFLLLLMASLSAGLVALRLWTTPDEDDAILRKTDYAERRRNQDRGQDPDHYDSDWIRGHGPVD
ncbi:DUF2905 domain-containing protein [Kocuria massiliensis]|uniref:DUF2905 domain-containing protein n=1 Tax=Kocuria massiliensis TaxID=1926282 RepID=UPI000A1C8B89|nr:DUF2905 domain-containing protein [Kocuria massiliensis]